MDVYVTMLIRCQCRIGYTPLFRIPNPAVGSKSETVSTIMHVLEKKGIDTMYYYMIPSISIITVII